MKFANGFTLLELLVVIVMIGIILSFATLSIHQGGYATQLAETSQRLVAVMTLASQEAIIQGQEIGIYFEKTGYRFYRLEMGDWQLQKSDVMRPYTFQGCIQAQLQVEGENIPLLALAHKTEEKMPQILLASSGEITPFIITLGCDTKTQQYRITGTANGTITTTYNE